MKSFKLFYIIILSFFILFFASCGGGGTGTKVDKTETGTLSLNLMDATTDDYKAVYITINAVKVHSGIECEEEVTNDWITIALPEKTYNLLELVNGMMENLGGRDMETGKYSQMRLIIGETPDNGNNMLGLPHPCANYLIDASDAIHELTIPSGFQSGVKLVHSFDITKGLTTELILDFDVVKSIVKAGKSGKYILKPTINIIDTIENATIKGRVTDLEDAGLEGVMVSAQIFNNTPGDIKDAVVVQTSTITDEQGNYTFYLQPGTYDIVIYKQGCDFTCTRIDAENNSTYIKDFSLICPTTTGVIKGTVTGEFDISEGDAQTISISFRQSNNCGGAEDEEIEVLFITIGIDAMGESEYSVNLPLNSYTVVFSTEGRETQIFYDVLSVEESDTVVDVSF